MEKDIFKAARNQTKKEIIEAIIFLREQNYSIPSETIEFIKQSSLEAINLPSDAQPISVSEDDIHDEAMKHSCQSTFLSDFPHDKPSEAHGFNAGAKWVQSKLSTHQPTKIDEEELKLAAYNIFMKALPAGRFTNINAEGYAEEIVRAVIKLAK